MYTIIAVKFAFVESAIELPLKVFFPFGLNFFNFLALPSCCYMCLMFCHKQWNIIIWSRQQIVTSKVFPKLMSLFASLYLCHGPKIYCIKASTLKFCSKPGLSNFRIGKKKLKENFQHFCWAWRCWSLLCNFKRGTPFSVTFTMNLCQPTGHILFPHGHVIALNPGSKNGLVKVLLNCGHKCFLPRCNLVLSNLLLKQSRPTHEATSFVST